MASRWCRHCGRKTDAERDVCNFCGRASRRAPGDPLLPFRVRELLGTVPGMLALLGGLAVFVVVLALVAWLVAGDSSSDALRIRPPRGG